MTDQGDYLMAAILDHPDEDAPRLVLADWLEEHGETARAEFIRVQCALAAGQRDPWDENQTDRASRHRSAALLERHGGEWARPLGEAIHGKGAILGGLYGHSGCAGPPKISWQWQCGFPSVITLTCEQLMGRVCERCRGERFDGGGDNNAFGLRPCFACRGTGRLPPLGPAIAAVCPVRQWKLDRRPLHLAPIGWVEQWWWDGDEAAGVINVLPRELFDLLRGGERHDSHGLWHGYPTADAAQAALNAAVNAHVRPLAQKLRRSAHALQT